MNLLFFLALILFIVGSVLAFIKQVHIAIACISSGLVCLVLSWMGIL